MSTTSESASPTRGSDVTARDPTATLGEVDILAELDTRPSRPPNYEWEHHGVAVLTAEMAGNSRNLLQKLCEVALAVQAPGDPRAVLPGTALPPGNLFDDRSRGACCGSVHARFGRLKRWHPACEAASRLPPGSEGYSCSVVPGDSLGSFPKAPATFFDAGIGRSG